MSERTWQTYEEVAAHLLSEIAHELGLERVEEKQIRRGERSKTKWEIDALGFQTGSESIVLIECKRFPHKKISQGIVADLAYRIIDTGAAGGIIVSPLGFQEGAARVAAAEGIISVQLNPDASPSEYMMRFLNQLRFGAVERMTASATLIGGSLEEVPPEELSET